MNLKPLWEKKMQSLALDGSQSLSSGNFGLGGGRPQRGNVRGVLGSDTLVEMLFLDNGWKSRVWSIFAR